MALGFLAEFIHAYPLIGIILFSLTISLLITLVIFFFTDREKMRELKTRQKELQKQAKEHQKNGNQDALLEVNKQLMREMPEMLKHSFKPLLITFIPIIIIFSWAHANIAYMPVVPQQEFTAVVELVKGATGEVEISVPEKIMVTEEIKKPIENDQVNWTLKGNEGTYFLKFSYEGETISKKVIITEGVKYAKVERGKLKGKIKSIKTNEKLICMNLLGWKLGWLGSYIIFSLIFGTIFRKVFKLS